MCRYIVVNIVNIRATWYTLLFQVKKNKINSITPLSKFFIFFQKKFLFIFRDRTSQSEVLKI